MCILHRAQDLGVWVKLKGARGEGGQPRTLVKVFIMSAGNLITIKTLSN